MTEAALDVFHRFGAFSGRDRERLRAEDGGVVGIFFGHVAGNIDLMSGAVARLPGFEPGAFEHQLFGLDPDASPVQRTRRRWPVVAIRAPAAIAGIRRRLMRERTATAAWWRATTAAPIPPDRARAVLGESRDRFATMLAAHSMQSQLAQGAFDAIARAADEAGTGGLERQLVTGYGGVEEAELAHELWAVSRDELELSSFLERHGFHGPNEGELSSLVWREDAAPVAGRGSRVRRRVRRAQPAGHRGASGREASDGGSRAARCAAAATPGRRPGRSCESRVVGSRAGSSAKPGSSRRSTADVPAARVLGASLAADNTLADPTDLFFLTYDEVMGTVPTDARALVVVRRARREAYLDVTLPPVWIGDPQPLTGRDHSDADRTITGVAVTPGLVVGRARVVLDAADCHEPITGDEVLVTRTTDPSWVSMFLTAGGLAIDIGGPMSHGAIVARELGIPCVIGTRDGTARIRDGARVELDGDTGVVRLLD